MRIIDVSLKKLRAMSGGFRLLAVSIFVCFLMFIIACGALGATTRSGISIAVVDNDKGDRAAEFIKMLDDDASSNTVIFCENRTDANDLSALRRIDGVLTIEKGFVQNIELMSGAFSYEPSPGSKTTEAAMELISGKAAQLRCALETPKRLEKLIGRELTSDEAEAAEKLYFDRLNKASSSVSFAGEASQNSVAAKSVLGAFAPRYSGFTAFIIMLVLLMLGSFFGSVDARKVSLRMRSVVRGRSTDIVSDYLCLMAVGIIIFIIACAAKWQLPTFFEIVCTFTYIFLVAALAAALGRLSSAASADIAMPLIAFITSLMGGCFADVSALKSFEIISLFTPQGQYIASLSKLDYRYAALMLMLALCIAAMTVLIHRKKA